MLAIFLDLEATGLDCLKHAVIDIAFKIIDLSSNKVCASYQKVVRQPIEVWRQNDPNSIEVNGYTIEEIANGDHPSQIREQIISIFTQFGIERGRAVFVCQNPGFDRSFFNQLIDAYAQERLNWPYHWLDLASMFWTVRMQSWISAGLPPPDTISLSKDSIANHYQLPPEPMPHRALNGVDHLISCYQAVFGINIQH